MILQILVGHIKFLAPKPAPPHLLHMKKAHLLIIQSLVQNGNTAAWRNRPANTFARHLRLLQLKHPFLFHISSYFMDLGLDSWAAKGTRLLNYSCNLHFLAVVDNWQVPCHLLQTSHNYGPYISVWLRSNAPFLSQFHILFTAWWLFFLNLAACFSHFWFQAFCST